MTKSVTIARNLIAVLLLIPILLGCRKPAESQRENRRLFDAILTAVTMKNKKELAKDEKLLDARHENGEMSDAAYLPIKASVEKASAGGWAEAESELYRLQAETPFPR